MSYALSVRRRTSGAARETEPAAEAVEEPVHLVAERLPHVRDIGLRRRRVLHFNRYICHCCLHLSWMKARYLDIDKFAVVPPPNVDPAQFHPTGISQRRVRIARDLFPPPTFREGVSSSRKCHHAP